MEVLTDPTSLSSPFCTSVSFWKCVLVTSSHPSPTRHCYELVGAVARKNRHPLGHFYAGPFRGPLVAPSHVQFQNPLQAWARSVVLGLLSHPSLTFHSLSWTLTSPLFPPLCITFMAFSSPFPSLKEKKNGVLYWDSEEMMVRAGRREEGLTTLVS